MLKLYELSFYNGCGNYNRNYYLAKNINIVYQQIVDNFKKFARYDSSKNNSEYYSDWDVFEIDDPKYLLTDEEKKFIVDDINNNSDQQLTQTTCESMYYDIIYFYCLKHMKKKSELCAHDIQKIEEIKYPYRIPYKLREVNNSIIEQYNCQ